MFNQASYRCRPFPIEAVRDLLGIARATYRCHRARASTDGARIQLLEQAGAELRNALKLAHHQPGSLGHATAWRRAERGSQQLCQFVGQFADAGGSLAAVVQVAVRPLSAQSRSKAAEP